MNKIGLQNMLLAFFLIFSSSLLAMNNPVREDFNKLMEDEYFSEALDILLELKNEPWARNKLSLLRKEATIRICLLNQIMIIFLICSSLKKRIRISCLN